MDRLIMAVLNPCVSSGNEGGSQLADTQVPSAGTYGHAEHRSPEHQEPIKCSAIWYRDDRF